MPLDPQLIHPKFAELFKGLFSFTDAEFSRLISFFYSKTLLKKEYYLRAGEYCISKAYLNKGCARNFIVDEEGRERILFFAFEDWWIGDFESYYSGKPGASYVQMLEDSELLLIPKDKFEALEREIPKLKQWYTYKMSRSASASIKRIEEMKTLSVEERYLNLLEKQPQIFQRVPLQYIASFLNIEPPSLSRMRKRLAKKR